MERNIPSPECNDKVDPRYKTLINGALRTKIREMIPEKELVWHAEHVLHIPASSLSAALNETRNVPAWLVVAMDKAYKTNALLEILSGLEDDLPAIEKPIDPRPLERLLVLILKEEGVFNSMYAQEVADHFTTPEGLDHLDRELTKVNHFLLAIRERIHELRDNAKKVKAS